MDRHADLHHFITIYNKNLSDTVLDVCGVGVRALHSFYNDVNSIKDAAIDPAILDHGFENIFYVADTMHEKTFKNHSQRSKRFHM